jgi:hypothetical protein
MNTAIQITCLLFLLTFILSALPAQTTSFGGRIGINSATVDIEDPSGLSVKPNSRVGLDIAAVVSLGITKFFSIQPELHFIQKGFKMNLEIFGEKVKTNTNWNYIELPVLAKYAFGSESVQGFVLGGPVLGVGLNGKTKAEANEQKEEEDAKFGSGEDELNRIDFGLAIGGGIGIPAGAGLIFLDARYLQGLANLSNVMFVAPGTLKNRGVNVAVGILFPVGR